MANFFTPKKTQTNKLFQCHLNELDSHAQGVGHWQNRVVFVAGGLPGERVQVQAKVPSKGPIKAVVKNISQPSEYRAEPVCRHYGHCGGCRLQHAKAKQQIIFKQQSLQRMLAKRQIEIDDWAPPITSDHDLGYRIKARLAVDARKQIKLGFRHVERQSVVAINQCPILHPKLEQLLNPLTELIGALQDRTAIGHVELLLNDQHPAIWLHRKGEWAEQDWQQIEQWCEAHQVQWLADDSELSYLLADFDVTIGYRRSHFIQSNRAVNQRMVAQAIEWLALDGSETVLDLFCGAGNFSLPLAKRANQVMGVEGVAAMVLQATKNAASNKMTNAKFYHADLSERFDQQAWWQPVDVVLLDPARAGAEQVVTQLHHSGASKVLYVSCNPATLVRDAAILNQHGYLAEKAGVMDMFPHTHHLESMILFSKN
ncbi:23S rRNA (uracil(1939)-C(5))-methyltransferase RlmD [Neiella marina]|uniref:23S rRNA (Uracil(1939)-C(5))-methyltransferase RlmD n=1 Tax=Neiella holothuriorum TaxID=2870530 RepID=A0ABS7EBK2_9GAMM|nr:23S rRNA (uracil(1939)-C(5))-methyltransferase RlmD [Neiella holothuriorum]MBW8189584.1 23S rRNA (uracil(1939)-C(5))-methyltransferase RlmD [Neiella holothuriorum]